MRLATFREGGRERLGVVLGDELADVTAGLPALSPTLVDWLPGMETSWALLRLLAERATVRFPLGAVALRAPVPNPSKFLALGANYASHLKEVAHLNLPLTEYQVWFNKQTSCICGPHDDMVVPAVSPTLDYEVELAVVIGRRCARVRAADAAGFIAGYMVCNDASVREWQRRAMTMTLGKSFDTHGPTGPWLVTADEVPDPQSLWLRTWVNGELRQDGNTSEMRFDIMAQIEELSFATTLMPGDILATGSPAGVGFAHQAPRYLQPGDVVRMKIEGIGEINNKVVAAA